MDSESYASLVLLLSILSSPPDHHQFTSSLSSCTIFLLLRSLQRCFRDVSISSVGRLVGRWRLVSASTTTTTTTASSVSKLLYRGTCAAYRRLLKINNQHGANSVHHCVCTVSQSEDTDFMQKASKCPIGQGLIVRQTSTNTYTYTHFKLRSNRPLSSSQQKHSLTYTKATHTQLLMMVMMMMMMMRWLAIGCYTPLQVRLKHGYSYNLKNRLVMGFVSSSSRSSTNTHCALVNVVTLT